MNSQWALQRIENDLRKYHERRKDAVASGLETPQLASLLLQKYAYGLIKAATIFANPDNATDQTTIGNLWKLQHELAADIDPSWKDTQARSWAARPAGLNY